MEPLATRSSSFEMGNRALLEDLEDLHWSQMLAKLAGGETMPLRIAGIQFCLLLRGEHSSSAACRCTRETQVCKAERRKRAQLVHCTCPRDSQVNMLTEVIKTASAVLMPPVKPIPGQLLRRASCLEVSVKRLP